MTTRRRASATPARPRSPTGAPSIRRATPRDGQLLAQLRYTFRCELAAPVEDERTFRRRCASWMNRVLREKRWSAWLAEQDGEALGCVWMFRLQKLPNPNGEPEHHAYVSNFYVRSESRGRGIGSMLMTAVLTCCEAEQIDSVVLWPTERSKPLYFRHGFRVATGILDRPVSAHF